MNRLSPIQAGIALLFLMAAFAAFAWLVVDLGSYSEVTVSTPNLGPR